MTDELTFHQLRTLSGNTDITDVPCPLCAGQCKTGSGRKRKCLRIWDDGGDFITFTCARCGMSGYAKPDDNTVSATPAKVAKQPAHKDDKAPLCNLLWDKSQPAIGSPVQVYLEHRQCWPTHPCPNVRYLPASVRPGGTSYPPTMISRFGFAGEPITGVHLTKLAVDGRGKAGTDTDKITMGDTIGQPIVVYVNEERDELVIAEGIEDTSTLTNVTGWNGWAAGTANRIPAVVAAAVRHGHRRIYVAKDVDWINRHRLGRSIEAGASSDALAQAAAVAPIIPLSFGGLILGMEQGLDANKMMIRHGANVVMAAIQWCECQEEYRRRLLSFHQFQRQIEPLRKILAHAT